MQAFSRTSAHECGITAANLMAYLANRVPAIHYLDQATGD
jgi:hypothetical protein